MTTASLSIEIPNPNHPKLGDTIKVEPIRTVNAINKLKKILAPSPRNYALCVVGINTAYRASELLSITLGQVRHLQPGDRLEVKQKKTKKYRAITMNSSCHEAIRQLCTVDEQELLFAAQLPVLRPMRHPSECRVFRISSAVMTCALVKVPHRWRMA